MGFWRLPGFLLLSAFCSAQQTGDIRLDHGSDAAGVVQLYHTDSWKSLCAWYFTDTEATVACKQLGFLKGRALPPGAFGDLSGASSYPEILNKCPTGQEASLTDCTFDPNAVCSVAGVEYASVHCFDDTPTPPATTIRLDSDPAYFTSVSVYGAEMWGRVCTTFWDDRDADVVCRQLGYLGGIATFVDGNTSVPFLWSEINCAGNETSLLDCPRVPQVCENRRSAAVVCHKNKDQGPSFSMVEGHNSHYGKVVFSVDGEQGLICKTGLTWKEAYPLCKTMGFTSGGVLDLELASPGVDTVVLNSINCEGQEESVYECTFTGWKETMEPCQGVSLYCYTTVRLFNALKVETEKYHMGRVELLDGDKWYAVCGDTFDKTAATVVCRELGYTIAVLLTPDSFSNRYSTSYTYVKSLGCTGSETSLTECPYTLGRCDQSDQHAALLCKQPDVVENTTWTLSGDYHGEVKVTKFGVEGSVCMEGWDEIEATVVCKAAGFSAGIPFSGSKKDVRYKPLWAFNFECMGGEISLDQCAYETEFNKMDWTCAEDLAPAGVLCFKDPPPNQLVRIVGGSSSAQGRVEVYSDTTGWGTVCDLGWSASDADVVCKQLGHPGGQTLSSSFSQADSNVPVVLANVQCDGTERSLFECPSSGWTKISTTCRSHTKDAGVYCYTKVKLDPFSMYGAVLYHEGGKYNLLCADGFDQNAASVVCKEVGQPYGKPVCCSGFGPKSFDVRDYGVMCSGTESTIETCMSLRASTTCQSGQYASVVCAQFQYEQKTLKLVGDHVVKASYFLHDGYICTEDFTDYDATVVCKHSGYTYGYAYKMSARDYTSNIRWLRGLGCPETATVYTDCSIPEWGQIGVCNWDAIAAVMCSNNQADLAFDVRLAAGTGTVGRLEVYIQSAWGTVCGNDLTQSEAVVVCRQLGYHDGIVIALGQYSTSSGDVLLSGFKCQGDEASVKDCIWTLYNSNSKTCDHSKDAAIKCYSNVRLAGSTTINYGRLEVFDETENDWVAMCDRNQNIDHANLLCRQLGYVAGMFQKGSPLGRTTRKIAMVDMSCSVGSDCTFVKGTCSTGKYIALYCSETINIKEDVEVRLPVNSFYGPVSIRRFGLWGHICSVGFDNDDAHVVCSQLGYKSGSALQTYATEGYPIIQGNVQCSGSEAGIEDCSRPIFADGHDCYNVDTVAAVICYDNDGVTLGSTPLDVEQGEMRTYVEVVANGQRLRVDMAKFEDVDAAVYCEALGYAGGDAFRQGLGSYGVSEVTCTGSEGTILECPGVWDPSKSLGLEGDLAGVTCYTSVRLEGGDPASYGAVITSKGVDSGPVCASGFDEVDAGVACSNLGHEAGLVLCCSPFGSLEDPGIMTNVQCTGNEKQFTDCPHDNVDAGHAEACKKDYAAVACYSGTKPTDYTLSLGGISEYTGSLVLTYLDINGSVCIDGWDDGAAHVACRELGFNRGLAYRATRSDSAAPFWTSQVKCAGTEAKLADCQMTQLGKVTECSNTLSHAGVICFDNDGMFFRLGGSGENRYGRVEVSLNGDWRSLCNLYWENQDTHVLCKMLGFRTGEAYRGGLRDTFTGPVWEANFLCNGTETTLHQCTSSGWRVSTVPSCALHQNDAAAFCYRSVKLSTGVGRETDQGAVLFYYEDRWYTICNKGFTEKSAKVVCRELGFVDGQVHTGSSYGALTQYPRLKSHTVKCQGEETDVTDCLVAEACDAQDYVSVVCYGFTLTTSAKPTETEKKIDVVPIVIAVVLFVLLIIIGAIVLYCLSQRRKKKKIERSKEPFDNTILSENVDGTVEASNRLHGLVNTPEVPRAHYSNREGNPGVHLERGYDNPLYPRDHKPNNVASSEYEQPRRSVISVNSNTYDKIRESRLQSGLGDSHQYDNLHPSQRGQEGAAGREIREDVVEKEADGPDIFISPFAQQGTLSSPTDNQPAPTWPRDAGATYSN